MANKRAVLRRGDSLAETADGPQKGAFVAVPLFHVTGMTSYVSLVGCHGDFLLIFASHIVDDGYHVWNEDSLGEEVDPRGR